MFQKTLQMLNFVEIKLNLYYLIAMGKSEINYVKTCDVDITQATPMMKQFLEIKKENQEVILLYRMGDFYETFFEDAITVAQELEITLTSREGGDLGRIPMAGVPVKAVDNYISKLLAKGLKVSICEQLEDPKEAKGLVKRDIVKTITAGTILENSLLNSEKNNYLAAILKDEKTEKYGFAYCDASCGEFKATTVNYEQLKSELARIKPVEILAAGTKQKLLPFQIVPEEKIDLPSELMTNYNFTKVDSRTFEKEGVERLIKEIFKIKDLNIFGYSKNTLGIWASGSIIEYLIKTQMGNLPNLEAIQSYDISNYVSIDANTRKNLELIETNRDKSKYGSLLWAIDKTHTNMGARTIKKWIQQPLKNVSEIKERQACVEALLSNAQARMNLAEVLKKVSDIERLSTKISNNSVNGRDFLGLRNSLTNLPAIQNILNEFSYNKLLYDEQKIQKLIEFASIIDKTIDENAPITIKEGGLIKSGVNGELDYFKDLLTGGEKWLKDLEDREKEKTGIKFLKVGYSRGFGYFIEITKSNLNLVPDNYIRRQTLTNAERFVTEELKNHEQEILSAQAKLVDLEYKIFCDLRNYAQEFVEPIREVANYIAQIDVLLSFANVSSEYKFVKPLIDESNDLFIKNGRHAVVERILPFGEYIANDLMLVSDVHNFDKTQFMILTGPNMAGKSTYMRQNALIVILAQIGCFVPADEAKIGIVDKIFTRVGAVDDLSLGQSTFMVEMSETANILNTATEKSLILLDEIGRGTSTYDGVAIAWSVAEYIATNVKARTIFATHYHELNVMASKIPQIKNYRITISEENNEIKFLRKVIPGSASKSYGIQVAKMAGLPKTVVQEAEKLMIKMQKDYSKDLSLNKRKQKDLTLDVPQLNLFNIVE